MGFYLGEEGGFAGVVEAEEEDGEFWWGVSMGGVRRGFGVVWCEGREGGGLKGWRGRGVDGERGWGGTGGAPSLLVTCK